MRSHFHIACLVGALSGCTIPVDEAPIADKSLETWEELGARLRAESWEFVQERELRLPVVEWKAEAIEFEIRPEDVQALAERQLVEPEEQCDERDSLGRMWVYPAHPFSLSKRYELVAAENYNHRVVPFCDERCKKFPAEEVAFCGEHALAFYERRGYPRMCTEGHTHALVQVIISDVFMDACGNFYRGYWQVIFESQWENDATLLSLGRTELDRGCYSNAKEMYDSSTYPLRRSEFLFFSELQAEEITEIQERRAIATQPVDVARVRPGYVPVGQGFLYDDETHLFRLDNELETRLRDRRYCFP